MSWTARQAAAHSYERQVAAYHGRMPARALCVPLTAETVALVLKRFKRTQCSVCFPGVARHLVARIPLVALPCECHITQIAVPKRQAYCPTLCCCCNDAALSRRIQNYETICLIAQKCVGKASALAQCCCLPCRSVPPKLPVAGALTDIARDGGRTAGLCGIAWCGCQSPPRSARLCRGCNRRQCQGSSYACQVSCRGQHTAMAAHMRGC
jgi:hypothetical protein